jgi:hypothetical protein
MKITLLTGILDNETQKQNYTKFCVKFKQLAAGKQDLVTRETRRAIVRAKFALRAMLFPQGPRTITWVYSISM